MLRSFTSKGSWQTLYPCCGCVSMCVMVTVLVTVLAQAMLHKCIVCVCVWGGGGGGGGVCYLCCMLLFELVIIQPAVVFHMEIFSVLENLNDFNIKYFMNKTVLLIYEIK